MKLWLDDYFPPPDEGWRWVKTAHEAIALLASGRVLDASLDNDLGPVERSGQGIDVCRWMVASGQWPALALSVHSRNRFATTEMSILIDRHGRYGHRVPGIWMSYRWDAMLERGWRPSRRRTRAAPR